MRTRALLPSLLLVVASLQAPSSGFQVISPQESETVVPQADGQGLRVRVDLGAHVRVPEHGMLAMYLDDTRVLLACPGSIINVQDRKIWHTRPGKYKEIEPCVRMCVWKMG